MVGPWPSTVGAKKKLWRVSVHFGPCESYPIQSIKRREQGTIISVLTLNKDGKLIKIEIKDRAPKRLYKATTKILNSFKFPKPPTEILDNEGYLRIKIPVNYILK